MPETISVRVDPNTGQEYEVRTETPPAVPYAPPDRSGMGGINRTAFNAAMAGQKVDDALKAAQAAVQFQGLRGYQNALKNGESPEKAMVKFGPLMFNKQATAFGPAQRAVTPPRAPDESPISRERFEFQKNQPIHVGQGLYKMEGGKPVQIVAPPDKALPFAIEKNILGKDKTARMTPQAFAGQMPSLPEYARTNASNLAQLRAAGITNTPAAVVPQSAPQTGTKRVRVKGPGNAKGTVLEGTQLPEGWSFEK